MNCERVKEQIPECLAGHLEKVEREKVIEHLETCAGCRNELAELGAVWRSLDALAIPAEPEPVMKSRFMEVMEAYQEGLLAAQAHAQRQTAPAAAPRQGAWAGFWPRRPLVQFALGFALLLVGVFAGRFAATPRGENPEMAQLKGQVEGLRQLVALSMLQEQSPSQRLQGVTYSVQMAQPDAQVEQALLHAVTRDPNIAVRLSAVEALEKYAAKNEIRRALEDAVAVQESPTVQVALIELLVHVNDTDSAPMLQKVAHDPDTDETVRQQAAQALQKLAAKNLGVPR
ncbi:Anti-ECFsigma factor, ChrR [Candidatus Sulfopaludibacter sp. SbA3]|nr:Anti-ECFsigma factor, ChrR [Candidatus Sulfopaludibacter sp. SbA3]